MTNERWIIIPRWDEFQHRDMARSTIPPWIKNYTQLLDDEDYLKLTPRQRGILHGIWLAYARSRRVLGSSPARLRLILGDQTVRARDIEALNHAGWLQLSASRPARNPASLEVEVEIEREASAGAKGRTPADDDFAQDEQPQPQPRLSELTELLDELDIAGDLRSTAIAAPARALAVAQRTLAAKPRNGAAYFRKLLESTEAMANGPPLRENAYIPDTPERIEKLIRNGAIQTPDDLEIELAAAGINGSSADSLHAMLGDHIPPELLHDTEPPDPE